MARAKADPGGLLPTDDHQDMRPQVHLLELPRRADGGGSRAARDRIRVVNSGLLLRALLVRGTGQPGAHPDACQGK
jgi:hypothetical protein